MKLSVGDRLPETNLYVLTKDGPQAVSTSDWFAGRKVVVFAVPGAFTATCHNNHVPNFLENLDSLKSKGVDEVACLAVNDVFVLNAWSEATGAKGKLTFLSDGNGEFTGAIGAENDISVVGLGIRSKRYVMLVTDGVVDFVSVEEARGTIEKSSAEIVLQQL
ncbi:MAG: peroxiredoxin [Methyloligellaceae bacterium]